MPGTFARALVGGLLLGIGLRAHGADANAADALRDAWQAYRYQTYEAAERGFRQAVDDPATQQQATLGLALVAQFRERRPNVREALRLYQQLLDEGLDGDARWQVLALVAECHALTEALDKANTDWEAVIVGAPHSLIAQDALLRRTLANLGAMESAQTTAAIRYLETHREAFPPPTRETPALAPAYDLLLGNLYFWRRDYARSRDAFMRYIAIGSKETTSYSQQASAMMRVARMSESLLDDPATAGRYYRMLVEQTPNDVRSYHALERAVRYGAITADEVRALKLYGISEALLQTLFTPPATPSPGPGEPTP